VVPKDYSWQRRRGAWGRPAAFGALAAGILAAFMLGPRFFGPPPVTAPAVTEDRIAAAPPPVYADLNNSSLRDFPATPMTEAAPEARAGRVPRAAQRQPAAPPAADARTASASAAAPAAQDALARSEASGRLDAGRAAGAPADMASAPASAAAAGLAKSRTPHDGAALWRAAETGDLATLRVLHEQRADLNATDTEGRTALMLATLHARAQAVEALLDYGADPNIAAADGRSPLAAALAANEGAIASALRAHGAR
jgi:hypothetical protein